MAKQVNLIVETYKRVRGQSDAVLLHSREKAGLLTPKRIRIVNDALQRIFDANTGLQINRFPGQNYSYRVSVKEE